MMKRLYVVCLFLFFPLTVWGADVNILQNSSFETLTAGVPDNWTLTGNSATFTTTTDSYSGEVGLKCHVVGGGVNEFCLLQQTLTLSTSTDYFYYFDQYAGYTVDTEGNSFANMLNFVTADCPNVFEPTTTCKIWNWDSESWVTFTNLGEMTNPGKGYNNYIVHRSVCGETSDPCYYQFSTKKIKLYSQGYSDITFNLYSVPLVGGASAYFDNVQFMQSLASTTTPCTTSTSSNLYYDFPFMTTILMIIAFVLVIDLIRRIFTPFKR